MLVLGAEYKAKVLCSNLSRITAIVPVTSNGFLQSLHANPGTFSATASFQIPVFSPLMNFPHSMLRTSAVETVSLNKESLHHSKDIG
jgi:hypothetical protein